MFFQAGARFFACFLSLISEPVSWILFLSLFPDSILGACSWELFPKNYLLNLFSSASTA
jgi:hypothetical protein